MTLDISTKGRPSFSQAKGGAAPTVCMIFDDDAEGGNDDFYAWGPE